MRNKGGGGKQGIKLIVDARMITIESSVKSLVKINKNVRLPDIPFLILTNYS